MFAVINAFNSSVFFYTFPKNGYKDGTSSFGTVFIKMSDNNKLIAEMTLYLPADPRERPPL